MSIDSIFSFLSNTEVIGIPLLYIVMFYIFLAAVNMIMTLEKQNDEYKDYCSTMYPSNLVGAIQELGRYAVNPFGVIIAVILYITILPAVLIDVVGCRWKMHLKRSYS